VSDDDDTLTVEEAAAVLKVNPATVQRELRAQRLPGNTVGRAWRIRRGDLRTYLKGQKRDPRQAIEYAHYCLHEAEDLDNALVTLVGSLGYEEMPIELRFALTRRVGQLIEARDTTDLQSAEEQAEKARWKSHGDDAFAITYYSTISPPWRVHLPGVWNKMLDEFLLALSRRRRRDAADQRGDRT
jgi:excisionase family DNA binding protein